MKNRLKQRRDCVYSVVEDGQSVEDTAALNRFDAAELALWVDLYQEHGESVFEASAASRFELELFRLKYPAGMPKTGLRHALRETFQRSKRSLLILLVIIPSCVSLISLSLLLVLGGGGFSSNALLALICGVIAGASILPMCVMMLVLETWGRLAKHKLRAISYTRTKRYVVDKQETAGGVSLSTDEPDAHGALAIADHDVGELMILDHDQEQRPVTAPHGASAKPGSGLT